LDAATNFLTEAGEDFAGILNPDGSVNREKLEALKKAKPIESTIMLYAESHAEEIAAETRMIFDGLKDFDRNDPIHAFIEDFALAQEGRLMAKPESERLDARGRKFLTSEKYAALPDKQKKDFWTFEAEDLNALMGNHLAKEAKKKAAEH